MKIKKRYIIVTSIILVILLYSLYIVYSENYKFYKTQLDENLKYTGISIANSYSNYFEKVHNDLDILIEKVEEYGGINDTIVNELAEFEENSEIISNVSIIYSDGSILYGNEKGQADEDEFQELLSKDYIYEDSYQDKNIRYIKDKNNVMNLVKMYNDSNGQHNLMAICQIDYEKIDNIYSNTDSFKIYKGYSFVISKEGIVILHPDKEIIGLNFFEDKTKLMEKLKMDEMNLKEITSFLGDKYNSKSEGEIYYGAYDTVRIGYYKKIQSFEGYSLSIIDFKSWEKRIFLITLKNILPILVIFIMALFLLLGYIYEIKYTDYFTGVWNLQAFNYYIAKDFKRKKCTLNLLLLKIENIIDIKDGCPIYNNKVFVDISRYFKTLNKDYDFLFRVSNEHYLFVVRSNDYELNNFKKIYNAVHESIRGKHFKHFKIKGKALASKIDDYSFDKEYIIENLMKYMEREKISKSFKILSDYNLIVYARRKKQKTKALTEQAILENRIVPYYQPILNLEENDVERYDVLMRIQQEDLFFDPKHYIDLADSEETISKIDGTIIQKTFNYLHRVRYALPKRVQLTINLNNKEISKDFVDKIIKYKNQYGITPRNITFKITESCAYESSEYVINNINRLKEIGFNIGIDNLGTKYLNVDQLEWVDIDIIKIDGRYIKDLHESEKDRKLLEVFIEVANAYGAKLVADSVENNGVLDVLKEYGVDYAQGYHIGVPKRELTKRRMSEEEIRNREILQRL